jgi:hypothetical protein
MGGQEGARTGDQTDAGRDVARIVHRRFEDLEREWAASIGAARMADLRQLLADVDFVSDG